jgi:hypothetical protein
MGAPAAVTQEIIVTAGGAAERVDTLPPEDWGPAELEAYTLARITEFHGEQLPCKNSRDIFEQFLARYGADAVRIARAAFDVHRGMWLGAPVSVARFGASSDRIFADRVRAALA